MELNPSDLTLIESYIKGELSESDVEMFNERVESDPSFKEHYEFMLATFSFIEERNQLEQKVRMKNLEEEWKASSSGKAKFFFSSKWLQVAAAVIFLCSVYYLLRPREDLSHLSVQGFEHLPSSLITHRSSDIQSHQELFDRAYGLYEIKSYEKAAPLLYDLYLNRRDTSSLLYAGISYLGAGNVEKALECLNNSALASYPEITEKYLAMIQKD